MAKRRTRSKPKPGAGGLLRGEIAGALLVLLSLVVLLSLLSAHRGSVTGALVDGLRVGFGAGIWLVPPVIGGLGIWLAMRDLSEQRGLSAPRVAGGIGAFLVIEALLHLLAADPDPEGLALAGGGGGALGWVTSQALVSLFGAAVTFVVLVLIGLISLMGVLDLSFAELRQWAGSLAAQLQGTGQRGGAWRINPPLPLGEMAPPWLRWWRRLTGTGRRNTPGTQATRPQAGSWQKRPDPAPARPPLAGTGPIIRGPQSTSGGSSAAPPAAAAGSTPAAPGQPRIIGGPGQTWHTPAIAEVLEDSTDQDIQQEDLRRRAQIIETTLEGFGVPVQVVEVNQGPAVTQFGLRPGTIIRKDRKGEEKRIKVRVSQIQALGNDLSLALSASPIRIEAPVPGRDFVGIEVPNVQISLVSLRGVMESEEYLATKGALTFGLGRDVSGQATVADLARMPHMLIAGATGSGKSVCVNAIISSLLLTHTPETLRLLMVDPKRVELTVYNGIPHLLAPVVVDVERAVPVLLWATREMERRYKLFARAGARNLDGYNEKLASRGEQILPYIVIIIDELADLMLSSPEEVERHICRIAQMARATGMHLVLATQRPSVDVVTGLIKANFPARIAFAVTSQIDSRVILDTPGAEQLLGRGDMLYMAPDTSKLQRLQGCFVSDRETQRLVRYWRGVRTLNGEPQPDLPPLGMGDEAIEPGTVAGGTVNWEGGDGGGGMEPPWLPGQEELQQPLWTDLSSPDDDKDDMYRQAIDEVRRAGRASVSLLQRRLRIGYSRAARLIDQMEAEGIVGPDQGASRGREVLPDPGEDAG